MNGLFWGKIWLLSGSIWLGMIWPWKKMTTNPTDQPYVLSPLSWSLNWAFHNLSTTINNNVLKVQFSHPKTGASRSRPSEWTTTMSSGTMLWMAVQVGSADYCYYCLIQLLDREVRLSTIPTRLETDVSWNRCFLKQETETSPAEAVWKPTSNAIWQLGEAQDDKEDTTQLLRTCSHLKGPTHGNWRTRQKPPKKKRLL